MEDLNELMRLRRDKLDKLRKMDINPYPYTFEVTHTSKQIKEAFDFSDI